MMFTFKDIQARLDVLSSGLLKGEYNYTYTFDNAIFNTYNYKGIELISFYVCCDSHIKVTYKYLNATMIKVINLVQQETTKEWVFYLNSFSILNELFSTLPKYVDYIDVHTLYNGSEFVEKVYLEVVDTYHINRYVESGKSFVKGYNNFVRFYTVDFDVTDAQDENKCFVESLLNIDLFKREEKNISNLNEVIKYVSD